MRNYWMPFDCSCQGTCSCTPTMCGYTAEQVVALAEYYIVMTGKDPKQLCCKHKKVKWYTNPDGEHYAVCEACSKSSHVLKWGG